MEALRSADEIRDVNTRYHDVAASTYDSKWGIDFGEVGQAQVLGKLRKVLGSDLDRGFERSLEIGAGTGYFSLNLLQARVVREVTCTDISPGMVRTLATNADRLASSRRRKITLEGSTSLSAVVISLRHRLLHVGVTAFRATSEPVSYSSLGANESGGTKSGREERLVAVCPLDPVAHAHVAVNDLEDFSLTWFGADLD